MRLFALSTLLGLASAIKYGYNHVPFLKDSDAVEAAFPDVDIELLSPAFLDVGSRHSGFANGTQGATSHEVMGSSSLLQVAGSSI
jgi:hypothetical protein